MNQQNSYFIASIRNSSGFQDVSTLRTNGPLKQYQPFNSSYQHDSKVANSIRNIENKINEVEALVKLKKNSISQDTNKPNYNLQSSTFQPDQPIKYSSTVSNNSISQNSNKEKANQLRGSCPNIFKKFDQTANLRSTTQFVNMNKWGFSSNANDSSRKQQPVNQQNQLNMVYTMKKTTVPFINEDLLISDNLGQKKNLIPKIQIFNPNKSQSSGQLPSFKYNLNNNFNKSSNGPQKNQNETHSPARVIINKTPTKFQKTANQNQKKSFSEISIKANKSFSASYNDQTLSSSKVSEIKSTIQTNCSQYEQKKFKSLHQIWQVKEKEKKYKKIFQGIGNNTIQPSKVINGFQINKVLGKGKFGEVFLARHHETGFITAIKKIVKEKVKEYKMIEQFSKQIKLHNALDHPNIVKFFGFFEDGEEIYLTMEYMNGGTLFDYLNEVYHLGVKEAIEYLRDIIEAIIYLHEKSIAHRDIKPQNIVISTEGVAKLCDFGWSAVIQTSRKTYCGTFDYAPPQILQRKNYDMSVDVWCIGVLTYELLIGRVPFQGEKRNQIMEKIVNVDKKKIKYPIDIPKQAKDFIEWLVQKDPSLRPKPTQLLKHPFFSLCPPKVKSKKFQS